MKINRTQINNLITLTSKEIKKLEESRNTSTLSDVAIDEKIEELNALFSLLSLEYFNILGDLQICELEKIIKIYIKTILKKLIT